MVFGMMAAVSQDLPAIYNFAQYKASKNSVVFDATGEPIGTLTSNQNKILLTSGQISPNIKNAVVAIEDSRFYEHNGVDFQGIGRALVKDVLSQSAQQGASTITEQFVKNALAAQGSRTVFEKFREAALAYRLERHWSKDKILTEYLNTIYFGEGAYGIEAAARTYFGGAHPGCGTPTEPCASVLEPWEAATLAAIIASPSAYDPKVYPNNTLGRRNLVLEKMYEQDYITHEQYEKGVKQALPSPNDIEPPKLDSKAPYFTEWLRQQLVERYGAAKAFFGGLKVKSTLDLQLQAAAEEAGQLLPGLPAADRLGRRDRQPQRRRQGDGRRAGLRNQALQPRHPGAPPARLLDQALHADHGAQRGDLALHDLSNRRRRSSTSASTARKSSSSTTTRTPTSAPATSSARPPTRTTRSTPSSPSKALKGKTIQDRTHSIAETIHKMGYADPISTNPAMVLGGLKEGVTPLGWAYAYSTIANDGDRVSGTLAPRPGDSPVAYTQVTDQDGHTIKGGDNDAIHTQVIPKSVAEEAKSILETVVSSGTGTHANIGASGQWGKTGTTENNGDAWFCGGVDRSHRLRLGRLRRHDDADDDALRRRAGDGRHLPGADLGQRDLGLGADQGRTRRRSARQRRRPRAIGRRPRRRRIDLRTADPDESEPAPEPAPRSQRHRRPKKPRKRNPREPAEPAPAAEAAGGASAAAASPPAEPRASRRKGCRRRRSARGARPLW